MKFYIYQCMQLWVHPPRSKFSRPPRNFLCASSQSVINLPPPYQWVTIFLTSITMSFKYWNHGIFFLPFLFFAQHKDCKIDPCVRHTISGIYHECITTYFSILDDHVSCLRFWLLWIKHIWTFMFMTFGGNIYHLSWVRRSELSRQ